MTTPAEIADSHLVLEGVDPDLTGKPQRYLIFLRALPRGEGPCRMTWLGESIHEGGAEGVRGSAVITLTAILERASREAWAKVDRLQSLCRELEAARDERDHFQRDLEEIGQVIGCRHLADGLARCVKWEIERLKALLAEKGVTP